MPPTDDLQEKNQGGDFCCILLKEKSCQNGSPGSHLSGHSEYCGYVNNSSATTMNSLKRLFCLTVLLSLGKTHCILWNSGKSLCFAIREGWWDGGNWNLDRMGSPELRFFPCHLLCKLRQSP